MDTVSAPPLDPDGHSVQFYVDATVLVEETARYIGSALGAGDAAVVVATPEHRARLAEYLATRGLDLASAAVGGRYVGLDAAATLSRITRDGHLDDAAFVVEIGGAIERAMVAAGGEHPRVAVFGEMVALLWAEGKTEAAIRLEQLWNRLARTSRFSLRCAYPLDSFASGEDDGIATICAEHNRVIPAESYTALTNEDQRNRAIAIWQQKARALETEIEKRKRIEAELRVRNEELRQAVSARDAFLSVAAHELKTPVTGVRAFVQLLLRDVRRGREIAPGRLESALGTIERQTTRLNQLMASLLDRAQIESGKLRIEPARTDLVPLIRAALTQRPRSDGHDVVFRGPNSLTAWVDPVRFEQVVGNLVDNAIKFSPGGGTVLLELVRDGESAIVFSVTDEGIGVPIEQRDEIFLRGYQVTPFAHATGLGLGLYLTREVVELHGGSIHVESPDHAGSRFVVCLPASGGHDPA